MGDSPMNNRLIDDNLFVVSAQPEWYADIVKFLTTQQLSREWTKDDRKKIRVNSRHFAVIYHRMLWRGADGQPLHRDTTPCVLVFSPL